MKHFNFLIVSLFILTITSCKSNKQSGPTAVDLKPGLISFIDSSAAATNIINDDIDGYFDQLSITDMQIQMKQNFPNQSKAEVKKAYLTFIKNRYLIGP